LAKRLVHNGDVSGFVSNYNEFSARLHSYRDECFGKRRKKSIFKTKIQPFHVGQKSQIIDPGKSHQHSSPLAETPAESSSQLDSSNPPTISAHCIITELNNINHLSLEQEKITCRQCGEMVWNKIANRLNHINVKHLHIPLYSCRICGKNFQSFSRSACYSHISFCHKKELESNDGRSIDDNIDSRKDKHIDKLTNISGEYFDV